MGHDGTIYIKQLAKLQIRALSLLPFASIPPNYLQRYRRVIKTLQGPGANSSRDPKDKWKEVTRIQKERSSDLS